jgi:hypothetical protein
LPWIHDWRTWFWTCQSRRRFKVCTGSCLLTVFYFVSLCLFSSFLLWFLFV